MKLLASLRLTGLAALAFAAAGCASADYQEKPKDGTYGYASMQTGDDTFTVWYTGDSAEPQRTMDFCRLRSAELSLARGFPYFEVLEVMSTRHAKREEFDPGRLFESGTGRAVLKIRGYTERPAGPHRDAAQLAAELRRQYGLN